MARLGEGDPRWLVKDMGSSGTNVNNWHWTEKDCMAWAKARLGELFGGLKIVEGPIEVTCSGVDSISGEAFLNNRKNKVIASYELDIKIIWGSSIRDGEGSEVATATGKLHLPYVADENHDEEPELKVVCDSSDSIYQRAKDAILAKGKARVFGAVAQMVSELRAGVPGGKPGAEAGANSDGTAAAAPVAAAAPAAAAAASSSASAKASSSGAAEPSAPGRAGGAASQKAGKQFSLTQSFYARPRDLYEALTQEGRLRAFTQAPASSDPKPGGAFSWFGGSVTGAFVELVPERRIVMDWRFSTWEEGCSSRVVIDLEEPSEGNTLLKLRQTGIPDSDKFGNDDALETTRRGWEGQVLHRIRAVFGYGM